MSTRTPDDGTGVNEFEATVCGVHFRDDADVPYSAATTATAEEDEIAFAHVGDTGNGGTLGVLTARRTGEREVVLTINVAGETAAIETMGGRFVRCDRERQ